MTSYRRRNGNRWTINECLQLQREFELLNLSVAEIADRHQRTPNAIMFKLDQEGFADYTVLYSNFNNPIPNQLTNKLSQDIESKSENEDEIDDDIFKELAFTSASIGAE